MQPSLRTLPLAALAALAFVASPAAAQRGMMYLPSEEDRAEEPPNQPEEEAVDVAAQGLVGDPLEAGETEADEPLGLFAQSLLDTHNEARRARGVEPLRWSNELARSAADYATRLASLDRIEHASESARGGAGENLWMGTTGFFSTREMMNAFLMEERLFTPGVFPDVSTSGNWVDVGHYTQIIWADTKEVGCAVADNGRNDFLVCRYLPAGNWRGVAVP